VLRRDPLLIPIAVAAVALGYAQDRWPPDDAASASSAPLSPLTTQPSAAPQALTSMPSVLPSVPVYGGDLWHRQYLTGDWGGARQALADNGVLFQFDFTQLIQGNPGGGFGDLEPAIMYGLRAQMSF